jgi:ribose transport system substrate-binding protein
MKQDNRHDLQESAGQVGTLAEQLSTKCAITGEKLVVNVDCNSEEEAKTVIEIASKHNVYFVTHFQRPADLSPVRVGPYYVAHIRADHRRYGRATALALRDAMRGSGGFIGLGGRASHASAQEREDGMRSVVDESSSFRLLEYQDANWSPAVAFDVVRWCFIRWGANIRGIWAANDGMALGAIEALRSHGLAGKVPVTGMDGMAEAVDAIRSKEMTASLVADAFWRGGAGLSYAVRAFQGETNPELTGTREPFGPAYLITRDSLRAYERYLERGAALDWNKPSGSVPEGLQIV